jgi:hypothetical protein
MLNKHMKIQEKQMEELYVQIVTSAKPTEYESPTSVLPDSVLKQW